MPTVTSAPTQPTTGLLPRTGSEAVLILLGIDAVSIALGGVGLLYLRRTREP